MKRRDFLKAAAAFPLIAQPSLSSYCSARAGRLAGAQHHRHRALPGRRTGRSGGAAGGGGAGKILGQPVMVDNRAGGAGGSVGNAAAARAEPDGYTLLMTLSSLAVLPEADRLFGRPPAYEVSQFTPVARILADPTLLAVPASAPWKTLKDFVDDAKKRPGRNSLRLVRPLRHVACRDGDVGGVGRYQAAACAVPRRRAGADRDAVRDRAGARLRARRAQAAGRRRQDARPRQLGRGADQELPRPADLQGARLPRCRVLHLGRPVRAGRRAGAGDDEAAQRHAAGDGRPRKSSRPSKPPAARRPISTRPSSRASSRPTARG